MPTTDGLGEFLDVDRIVRDIGVTPGQRVADLGCGSGYFVNSLAKAVGDEGVVIAVDIMQEALQAAQARAEAMGFKNVQAVHADLEVLGGTKITEGSQDLALLKNVLFQSQKKDAMIHEAVRITKSGGRVAIIDWKKGAGGLGPPDNLRSDEAAIRQLAEQTGLRFERSLTPDQFHFGIICTK